MHFRKKIVTIAMLALTAIAAGAKADGPNFSYGIMQSSCAPWDGPAVEMKLTTEPAECKKVSGPFLSVAIWRGLPIHPGQVVNLDAGSGAGSVARCAKSAAHRGISATALREFPSGLMAATNGPAILRLRVSAFQAITLRSG